MNSLVDREVSYFSGGIVGQNIIPQQYLFKIYHFTCKLLFVTNKTALVAFVWFRCRQTRGCFAMYPISRKGRIWRFWYTAHQRLERPQSRPSVTRASIGGDWQCLISTTCCNTVSLLKASKRFATTFLFLQWLIWPRQFVGAADYLDMALKTFRE